MTQNSLHAKTSIASLFVHDDLVQFTKGTHHAIYNFLGAHPVQLDGQIDQQSTNSQGVRFAVWAPNASQVSVIGDFNGWDTQQNLLEKVYLSTGEDTGIWAIVVTNAQVDHLYQFHLHDANGQALPNKADPLAFAAELAPGRASKIVAKDAYQWSDQEWINQRNSLHGLDQAMSIYELHLGSWSRYGRQTYRELAQELIPYVSALGFTHIELLPITEFPYDGSWGYQTLGLFAPTSRYGTPEDLCYFVDQCHQAHLGVILDWVPGHFPFDDHGLYRFDGSALYEHEDPRRGVHPDWKTALYQYGRYEVKEFLISSALFWLEHFHIDGIRVDAVASMLYLDYSRKEGEWIPNQYGGREHLEAVDFLKALNEEAYARFPGIVMIAEESTSWPGVSAPTYEQGLGFGRKWNMGWMNDTLRYIELDPIHRKYNTNLLTFGLVYQYSERFILPISHDEVVHGKGSLINKMPGDPWQKSANLRLYLSFMWTHPGQKLLFMGSELGQTQEWSPDRSLEWLELDHERVELSITTATTVQDSEHNSSTSFTWQNLLGKEHSEPSILEEKHIAHEQRRLGIWLLLRRLNTLYRRYSALHSLDMKSEGFKWLLDSDHDRSVFSFIRQGHDDQKLLVILNFTPVPRLGERVGIPMSETKHWQVILNSDETCYAGSGVGPQQGECIKLDQIPWQGEAQSTVFDLPPLAAILLSHSAQ